MGASKSGDVLKVSAPVVGLIVNLPASAPPAIAKTSGLPSASVAVNVPTAIWFSAAMKLVDEVKLGAVFGPSVGSSSRRPSSWSS